MNRTGGSGKRNDATHNNTAARDGIGIGFWLIFLLPSQPRSLAISLARPSSLSALAAAPVRVRSFVSPFFLEHRAAARSSWCVLSAAAAALLLLVLIMCFHLARAPIGRLVMNNALSFYLSFLGVVPPVPSLVETLHRLQGDCTVSKYVPTATTLTHKHTCTKEKWIGMKCVAR